MKVVAVAHQKGGVGKSTLSAHLAVAADLTGTKTVLIDFDPQGSLTAWWNGREAQTPALATGNLRQLSRVLSDLESEGVQLVIMDTPPGTGDGVAQLLASADLLLIPVRPSPHDLRAVGATVALAQAAQRPFAFVLNAAKSRSNLTPQAVAILSQHGPVAPAIVGDRSDLVGSMANGETALETAAAGKAAAEIRALWAWVASELKPATKKPASRRKGV